MWLDVDTALAEVPINCVPLIDDTDFKSREESVVYNQAGLDLVWNFVTSAGAYSQTAVTPTDTGGDYDWVNQGNGMYSIEIPASGGASINNDTEGYGWFTGVATGILPWAGPIIGFRAAGLNDKLTDSAYSAARGLGGTALPDAAADAAGGVPISDAGGLDIDAKLANTNEVTAARMGALTDWINDGRLDAILDAIATDAARLTAVRAAVLTDWINGGRLDLLIDAIKAKTDNLPADPADDSDIDAQLATITGYLDTEIAAILAAVDTEVAAIKAKTDNLPADPASETNVDANETKIDTVDTVIDAIKAKTDNLPASPAAVGSEMNLADDAITAAKHDESTAYPVSEKASKAASTMVLGTVSHDNTPATTTVFYCDDITEATADHYNGRIVIFTSGALLGQATDITDYALDTGEGKFTVTALTEAPADNVTFVIV